MRVIPDEVTITLGVETFNEELIGARSENDQRVDAVLDAARKHTTDEKQLQTDKIRFVPYRQEREGKAPRLLGYYARKNIVITLRDLSEFEGLLVEALDAGANYIHGIEFRTTELRRYRDQARAMAIRAARDKAEALVSELGQRIGKATRIQEVNNNWWSWYNRGWGGRGLPLTQNVIQTELDPSSGRTFAVGLISVTAKIRVDFELR